MLICGNESALRLLRRRNHGGCQPLLAVRPPLRSVAGRRWPAPRSPRPDPSTDRRQPGTFPHDGRWTRVTRLGSAAITREPYRNARPTRDRQPNRPILRRGGCGTFVATRNRECQALGDAIFERLRADGRRSMAAPTASVARVATLGCGRSAKCCRCGEIRGPPGSVGRRFFGGSVQGGDRPCQPVGHAASLAARQRGRIPLIGTFGHCPGRIALSVDRPGDSRYGPSARHPFSMGRSACPYDRADRARIGDSGNGDLEDDPSR